MIHSTRRLGALGIERVGDLLKHSREEIESRLGQLGGHIWDLAHGIDPRRVISDREAKSISHETTFAVDIGEAEILRPWLVDLVEQVARRLRREVQGQRESALIAELLEAPGRSR